MAAPPAAALPALSTSILVDGPPSSNNSRSRMAASGDLHTLAVQTVRIDGIEGSSVTVDPSLGGKGPDTNLLQSDAPPDAVRAVMPAVRAHG